MTGYLFSDGKKIVPADEIMLDGKMTAYEIWMADNPTSTIDEETFKRIYVRGFNGGYKKAKEVYTESEK